MISTIEIKINKEEYLIDTQNKTLYNNQKKYNIETKEIDKILNIIILWKYDYGYSNTIDAEEFYIKVTDNNNEETIYQGKGNFPNNYNELKNILESIKNG